VPRTFNTAADYLDAAREMARSNRWALARLLAEEAVDRTPDAAQAARILAEFPAPNRREEN